MTAPSPRLVQLLEKYSGCLLANHAFITPNGLPYHPWPATRAAAQPSQIVWIQSDIAALVESRAAVVQAVEDFSRKYQVPLILIGETCSLDPASPTRW